MDLNRPLLPGDFPTVPWPDHALLAGAPDALRAAVLADGVLYLRGLIDPSRVAALRQFVREFGLAHDLLVDDGDDRWLRPRPGARFEGRGWDDPRFVELQRILGAQPTFQAVAADPALLRVLDAVATTPLWLATANYCWLKLPGSPAQTTRPHQDAYYLPNVPGLWTVWVPLTDTPIELGPLGVVPGSHRRAYPHEDAWTGIDLPAVAPDTVFATGPVQVGDVVVFGPLAVHGAWSNVTPDLVRTALDLRFEPRPASGGTALRPEAGP